MRSLNMIAWSGIIMLWIGFFLLLGGIAFDFWDLPTVGDFVSVETGLFRHRGNLKDETAKVVRCIQAFVILGVLFSGFAVFLATEMEKQCIRLTRKRSKLGTVAAVFSFCSGVFTLIGVIIYAAKFPDFTDESFSLHICVAGLVFTVAGGFLICVFVKRSVSDPPLPITSSRQSVSLPLSVSGDHSTEMGPLGQQRQRQQQHAAQQLEHGRQQLQLQREEEELRKRKRLLQQEKQNLNQRQKHERKPLLQLLRQQQQLMYEQQRLYQLENQLLLRRQQLRRQEEQLQQEQEERHQQQQRQQQQQTQRHHGQESQNNSCSQPQIFTLSLPSYESIQPAPSSGAPSTQSTQPSVHSTQLSNEPQTLSAENLPPPYESTFEQSVETLPPPYESTLQQSVEPLPPPYESTPSHAQSVEAQPPPYQ